MTQNRPLSHGMRQSPAASSKAEALLERMARHRSGLVAVSFAESTIVPIPLETIVAPLMVGHPGQALRIAVAIWLGCLTGALAFYALGASLVDPLVRPALDALGLTAQFEEIRAQLDADSLFWTVFLVSFSPAPMQLVTLGAGAAQGNPVTFLAAIALSRGLRYFGLAVLAQIFGPRIAALDIPKRFLIPGLFVIFAVIWGVLQLV